MPSKALRCVECGRSWRTWGATPRDCPHCGEPKVVVVPTAEESAEHEARRKELVEGLDKISRPANPPPPDPTADCDHEGCIHARITGSSYCRRHNMKRASFGTNYGMTPEGLRKHGLNPETPEPDFAQDFQRFVQGDAYEAPVDHGLLKWNETDLSRASEPGEGVTEIAPGITEEVVEFVPMEFRREYLGSFPEPEDT